jgi:hypothetical protein
MQCAALPNSARTLRSNKNRMGMSLLEVLVSLGILAAGLASIAALLPAAGARLGDAAALDGAVALAANVNADLRIRGALVATMFSGSAAPQAVVSGSMFSAFASSTSVIFKDPIPLYPTTSLIQNDLQLGVTGTTVEQKDSGVCCGVTVVPMLSATSSVNAGATALISVATFKNTNVQSQRIVLTAASGTASVLSGTNAAVFTTGSNAAADSVRKQFLRSCAWVLASNTTASGTARPMWLQIGGSWTTTDAAGLPNGSYVSFSNPAGASTLLSSGSLTVQGFTNIIRVDERTATLR